MRFLIGVDDTDNPKTSNTGLFAVHLGIHLQEKGFGRLESVSRHQLLHSVQVPCTSDNSAACLIFEADTAQRNELEMACRSFILHEFAPGANTGFAMAAWVQVSADVVTWARLVKSRVMSRQDALQTARQAGIAVAGITGSGAGVIGALAALGLRFRGNDGCILWLPNMSALEGVHTCIELMDQVPFDAIETLKGKSPRPEEKIALGEELRPVLREGRCVLLVEAERRDPTVDWHTLSLQKVRDLSD